MSLQDKYDEYKERQEAKKYFRAHNDQFLDSHQWGKTIAIGLLTAICCGIVLGFVIHLLSISSSLFYIICGYVIGTTLTRVTSVHSQQMAITSVVMTFLCFYVSTITISFLNIASFGFALPLHTYIFTVFIGGFQSLFVGNFIDTLMIVIGLYVAYSVSK